MKEKLGRTYSGNVSWLFCLYLLEVALSGCTLDGQLIPEVRGGRRFIKQYSPKIFCAMCLRHFFTGAHLLFAYVALPGKKRYRSAMAGFRSSTEHNNTFGV